MIFPTLLSTKLLLSRNVQTKTSFQLQLHIQMSTCKHRESTNCRLVKINIQIKIDTCLHLVVITISIDFSQLQSINQSIKIDQ